MLANQTVAALVGIVVPLVLDRFDVDPAVASSIFVTAMTDATGFFAFLGLATWLLDVMQAAPGRINPVALSARKR